MKPDERCDRLLADLDRLRRGETGAVGLAGARVVAGAQVLAAHLVPDPADDGRLRVEVGRWQPDADGILGPVGGDPLPLALDELMEGVALLGRAESALPAALADLADGAALVELAAAETLVAVLTTLPGGTRWLALADRRLGPVVGVPIEERDRLRFVVQTAAELVASVGLVPRPASATTVQ